MKINWPLTILMVVLIVVGRFVQDWIGGTLGFIAGVGAILIIVIPFGYWYVYRKNPIPDDWIKKG